MTVRACAALLTTLALTLLPAAAEARRSADEQDDGRKLTLLPLARQLGLRYQPATTVAEPETIEGRHAGPSEPLDESGGKHGEADETPGGDDHAQKGGHHSSRLTEEKIPLQLEGFPKRPKPILELGPNFLGTGTLKKGLKLPTGATWQPAFLAFGTLRTAVQTFDNGSEQVTEAAARLDLFGNLQLSGTERLVIGFRNFDENGMFTSYVFDADREGLDGYQDELNTEVSSLFFEGDFGEIFPNLSKNDFARTDWGFSVGRQPMLFQEGLLINDVIDGVGLTRNTLLPNGTSNVRLTFFYGWNELNRTNREAGRANLEDESAELVALLTSTDFRRSTVDIDATYVFSDFGDLANLGISAVQRIGKMNSSFRVVASRAVDEETAFSTDGVLVFSELSWTPHYNHNLVYFNTFAAFDDYSASSRDPAVAGPLGRAGINFASVGLGRFGAPLSNQARDVAGGAFGYQRFWDNTRKQFLVEVGARVGTSSSVEDQAAATFRYQQAMLRHFVLRVDAFGGLRESLLPGLDDDTLYGARLELITKF